MRINALRKNALLTARIRKFAAMRAQTGDGRWLCFDVVFEFQLLQVEFMEAG